jgi:serine/threonine-protein kinase
MLIAGKYETQEELGRGGMGVVYLAKHVEMDRRCALKMLHVADLNDPDAMARFHREARSASRISHPNVVAVYDFGKAESGDAYLAMEYVQGTSLEQLLADGVGIDPRRTARIIWQVANGLTAAHDLGIVHRDLKPGNIMLTRYRQWDDFVKVVDFGIAKPVDPSTQSNVTTTGLRVGTPRYMSPEQWVQEAVDPRSDIFALALITVELLAGRLPSFQSGLLTSGKEVIDAIPAARSWPASVKAVLVKGLSPDPELRHRSAHEFASELVTAVNQWIPPAPGTREPWDERLTKTASRFLLRRWRWPVAAVLLVVGGAAVLVLPALRKGTAESVIQPASPDSVKPSGAKDSAGPPSPGPPPPAPSAPRVRDQVATLGAIFNLDRPDPDSARRVVTLAGRLLRSPLSDSVRVEVSYRLAEAELYLGENEVACSVLREMRPLAARTGVALRATEALIARQCP